MKLKNKALFLDRDGVINKNKILESKIEMKGKKIIYMLNLGI